MTAADYNECSLSTVNLAANTWARSLYGYNNGGAVAGALQTKTPGRSRPAQAILPLPQRHHGHDGGRLQRMLALYCEFGGQHVGTLALWLQQWRSRGGSAADQDAWLGLGCL